METIRKAGFLIAKVHQLSGRIFSRMLKDHDISEINPAQGRILFVLWESDEIPISELARKTELKKSTLTTMLDRLEKNGYIQRSPSPSDRRIIIIRRTRKDISFQKKYYALSQKMNSLFYQGFSEKEKDLFEAYLQRILNNLKI